MTTAYVALGSSLGDANKYFENTEKSLIDAGIRIIKKSSLIQTPPIGGVAKNIFTNAVWRIETDKSPRKLLELLQQIENENGRIREKKWDDRTLDLDILLFGSTIVNEPDLVIPHPEMEKRDFVMGPLSEVMKKPINN